MVFVPYETVNSLNTGQRPRGTSKPPQLTSPSVASARLWRSDPRARKQPPRTASRPPAHLFLCSLAVSPYYRTKLRGLYTTAKADAEAECK